MLHLAVESAFDELLAQWRAHDARQRKSTLSIEELAASRQKLDIARNRMHKLRATIYPAPDEMESVITSVFCETLDLVVHLRLTDRHETRPGNLACPCGELVPIDWDRLRFDLRRPLA